jgi:hypothetical protein
VRFIHAKFINKRKGVMLKKLRIVNGPPFRTLLFHSRIIDGNWNQNFTVQEQGDPKNITLAVEILHLGRFEGLPSEETSPGASTYSFIAKHTEGTYLVPRKPKYGNLGGTIYFEITFLIGTYDARTRQGSCLQIDDRTMFENPLMRELFGSSVDTFIRERAPIWKIKDIMAKKAD